MERDKEGRIGRRKRECSQHSAFAAALLLVAASHM